MPKLNIKGEGSQFQSLNQKQGRFAIVAAARPVQKLKGMIKSRQILSRSKS